MSETERPRRRWIGRAARAVGWAVLVVLGLAALLVGLLHVPPVQRALSRAAVREADRALEGSVESGSIRWNALTGTLEVRDLLLRGEGDRAGTEVSVPRARIRFSVPDFLRGRLVVRSAVVERPSARLALDEEGRLVLPFRIPETEDEEPTARPDVDVRDFRLTGGSFQLTDRGKAARHVEGSDLTLEGRLRLRDLASAGTLALGKIDVSSAGQEPLRGSSLTARWTTRDDTLDLVARLVATEAGLTAGLDAAVRDLSGTPGYSATFTTRGTLGPLAARLAPDLGLGGSIEARIVVTGEGTEPPSATATARAETLTLFGRSFERVDFAGDLAEGLLRKGSLDATSGRGRLHAEASGTLHPAPKDVRFSIRAEKLDLARLLVLPTGAPKLAATLEGTVEGTLARPVLEGITATADLALTGTRPSKRGTLAPDARARLSLSGGILTAETVKLTERETTADLSGRYDHRQQTFEGRVDVESGNVGPWLAMFGIEGKGQLTAHLSGGGPVARPVLDGHLRARALTVAGARIDSVDLDAKANGATFTVFNGLVAAYDVTAGVEVDGRLPLPGVKSPEIELRVRGIRFRGRSLSDVDAHAALGATVEARLGTADGRLTAKAVAPARGGFEAEATLVRFDLSPLAAVLPSHLTDFHGEVSGHLAARRSRTGPLEATVSLGDTHVAAAGRRISTSGGEATVRGVRIELAGLELKGDDGSFFSLSGRGNLDGSALDGRVRLEVPDLAAFDRLLPPESRSALKPASTENGTDPQLGPLGGSVSGDVRIAGDLERPLLTGTVKGRDLVAFGGALSRLDAALKPDAEGRVAAAVTLAGLSWGDYRVEDARLDGVLAGSALTAEAEAFGGQLRMKATGSLAGPKPFDVSATLAAFDLAPLLRAAGGPADVTTATSGTVRVRGTVADLTSVAVDLDLATFEAKHPRWDVRAEAPVRIVVEGGRLDVRSLRLSGSGLALEASGSLPLEGRGAGGLSVVSSLDLGFLLPFVDALDRASGRLSARLDVSGSLASPVAAGTVTLEDGLLDGPDLPSPVEGLTGTVTLSPDRLRTDRLAARIGGGSVVLAGSVGLEKGRPSGAVDATVRGRGVELEVNPDLMVRADADLTARGEWRALVLGGQVRVEEAVYVPAFDLAGLLGALTERARRPPPPVEPSPWLPRLSFDLAVQARDAIRVEGDLGDADLGGSFRVNGTVDRPVVLGTLSSSRGTVNAFGTRFDISRADLEFKGRAGIDPDLDVLATTTRGEEEITVRVDGRASRAQLILSSSKGRSHTEIVSVLFGGSGEGGPGLAAAAGRMALRSVATPILGALGAHTDLVIVPLPTTPEGEQFLFSVGKELGGGLSATYYKGAGGETNDAFELRLRLGSKVRGRLRQNQDGSLSGGLRIRHDLD
jgi:autotransporter translocation and assembly factor TamB